MRRLIDEYGLAILYAIVGIICIAIFGWLFFGQDNSFSKVINNVVDKTTDSTANITYDVEYDLNGGYYEVKKVQNGLTLKCKAEADKGTYCKIHSISDITGFVEEDNEGMEEEKKFKGAQQEASGARYYELTNEKRLWVSYTKDKSYEIPNPSHDKEIVGSNEYSIFFDGWTSSSLNVRTRNVIISKGSTGTKKYTANWTKGKYKVTFDPGVEELRNIGKYKIALDNGFEINSLLSGNTSDMFVEYSTEKISFPMSAYEFLGHKFKYWTDGTKNYYPGTTYSVVEPIINMNSGDESYISGNGLRFYAVWEIETYKINYVNWKASRIDTTEKGEDDPQNFEESYTNYTVLDDFSLEKATMPGFKAGLWYTINPYLYEPENLAYKTFGTYSFKGKNTDAYFFGEHNLISDPDMISAGWNHVTTSIYKKTSGSLTTTTEFLNQHVSFGTYGDIILYSYFFEPEEYKIELYEKHLEYTMKKPEASSENTLASWIESETEPALIGFINFKYDSTIDQIFNFTLTTERLVDYKPVTGTSNFSRCSIPISGGAQKCGSFANSDSNFEAVLDDVFKKTLNYEFEGFEDKNGNLVFMITQPHDAANAGQRTFAAVGEESLYWSLYSSIQSLTNLSESGEPQSVVTNRYHWAYPENLVLYTRWKPMTYIIKLHSNY